MNTKILTYFSFLSQACQPALLNFSQCPASRQEGNQTKSGEHWEGFEQVPACVVEEEDTLNANNGTDKQRM